MTPIATRTREINSDDVRRVIETARAVALSPDREIIHILPQEFTVDDQYGIGDPLGMVGTRLEVNVHIVTSSTTAAQNIVTAVNRSGLLVGDTVLEPIAVGEAILSEDEKELGSRAGRYRRRQNQCRDLSPWRGAAHRRGAVRRRTFHQRHRCRFADIDS